MMDVQKDIDTWKRFLGAFFKALGERRFCNWFRIVTSNTNTDCTGTDELFDVPFIVFGSGLGDLNDKLDNDIENFIFDLCNSLGSIGIREENFSFFLFEEAVKN